MADTSSAALVAYLRSEADIADLRAQRLKEQADALAREYGIQEFPILDASEMAPLDEFGVPKYKGVTVIVIMSVVLYDEHIIYCTLETKYLTMYHPPIHTGKKRGRKPKPRQRHHNPNRKKRSHTAYTLFVQENHPVVRARYPDLQSKDIIGLVARQWATINEEEKQAWKQKAIASAVVAEEGLEDDEEEDEEEEEEEESEEDEEPKKKSGRPKKK